MTFFLTLLYITLLYVRPLDLNPDFAEVRVMFYLGITAIPLSIVLWYMSSRKRRATMKAPQIWMTLLFVFLAIFSWLRIGWWEEASNAISGLQPMFGCFLMIVLNVNTMKRLRILLICFVLCVLFINAEALYSLQSGWQHENFVMDTYTDAPEGQQGEYIPRMHHLGFLSDPNDFAQTLATTIPLVLLAWRKRKYLVNFLVLIPIVGFLGWGIVETHSRGGLVSVGMMSLFWFREKLGKVMAGIITTTLVLILLTFNITGGRAMKDPSSDARIEAWASGILMLREHPFLGVGYNAFLEYHRGLTAHNSFVLCFSEMGTIGYFVWMSLIVLSFIELNHLLKLPEDDPVTITIRRWAGTLRLSFVTFLTAAYFLSRTYIMTFYLLVAMILILVDIAGRTGVIQGKVPTKFWMKRTLVWELASIALIWVSVKANGA